MTLPTAPPAAVGLLGAQLGLVTDYGRLLAGDAVVRGLIGPRETARLWERHLLNCAAVTELLPFGARVVDVGSGAGLPGLVLACARPDLTVDLVDSLARRTSFLTQAVEQLGLADRVRVHTGRAEDPAIVAMVGGAEWVTARAVAPLDRLARWCLPLVRSGGSLLAIKGSTAQDEMDSHRRQLTRLGAASVSLAHCGSTWLAEPVRVVVVVRR